MASAAPSRPARAPRRRLAVVVLAAGRGTRLPGPVPKVLVPCLGLPILEHVRRAVAPLRPDETILVVGHRREEVVAWAAEHWKAARPVVQEPPRGTGEAARLALHAMPAFDGDLVVAYGDVPTLETDDLKGLLEAHRREGGPGTVLVGSRPDPGRLGRVLRDAEGRVRRIVEAVEATPDERKATEFNTGVYAFDAAALRPAVESLPAHEPSGEEWLTDAVDRLAGGRGIAGVAARDADALLGVNTPTDLAASTDRLRRRVLAAHMAAGVQVVDPETTWVEPDVTLEPGARILPFTYVGRGCKVAEGCSVGPFAHVRGGAVLEKGSVVGNFVEVKATRLGAGAKAKHLAYLGDADVGAEANVGCGAITANYDGVRKHRTRIGARARIGSGTVLVAPVSVADGAVTGANAVVLAGRNVPKGATAVGVPARVLPRAKAGKASRPARTGGKR
jgi:bifunctional UDP-N-acetylglucosamine pyrophosphorylase/glucosamine-1-phosphate N-acetyltransferase